MTKRILFVDVGTHMAQEYQALFSTQKFGYWKLFLKHRLRVLQVGGEKLSYDRFKQMIDDAAYLQSQRGDVTYVMVEPNPNLFAMPIYRKANMAFCIALSDSDETCSLMKLYFANKDRTGQGSSLFEAKPNVSLDDYARVMNVDSAAFVRMIKDTFENEHGTDYTVILRLNNEGAEVGVIKGFEEIFGEHLGGVLGSLSDVAKVHGQQELDALFAFMEQKKIQFTPLFSAFLSWPDALSFVRRQVEGKR